jgi:hypothetical protein
MFPLWFALLGGSFVFLDVGPSILFLVFFFLGALVNLLLAGFHQNVGHWGAHLFLFCNWGPKRCFYWGKCLMFQKQIGDRPICLLFIVYNLMSVWDQGVH